MEVKFDLSILGKIGWMILTILLWPINVASWIHEYASKNVESMKDVLAASAIISWILGGVMTIAFFMVWCIHGPVFILLIIAWIFLGWGFYSGRLAEDRL